MTLSQLTELLGWAAVINVTFLIVATFLLASLKQFVAGIHSRMFGIPEADLALVYFNYLANYKMLVTIFVLVPYIALKIMGQ